ncbi:MAG: hypothetical protein H0W33_11505 [Gammaproteobacteria bacterium]|nr:hypothetical protein [Gammaproteobacteria bacterium]
MIIAVLIYPIAVFFLLDSLGAAWLGGLLLLLLAIRGGIALRNVPQLAWPAAFAGAVYLRCLCSAMTHWC